MAFLGNLAERARDKLHDWGWNWEHADWSNWRTYTPAAGSAVVHVALFGMVIGLASAFSERAPEPPPRVLEITLLAETPPPPREPPPEAPAPKPAAAETPPPDSAPVLPSRKKTEKPSAAAPAPEASAPSQAEGEYIPPSPLVPGAAALASLMGDPCRSKTGLRIENCNSRPSNTIGQASVWETMSKKDKERFYAEYTPDCPFKVGCDQGEWRSINGTRSSGRPPPGSRDDRGAGTPMAGGAAGLGGPHDMIGRLGFNPDHTDPGFGD